jgi:starvation-inducible DNA-binding protein
MMELVEALKKAQATTFALYLKAHNFHWNVEGPDFAQYHSFLGDFYEEVFGAVDTIAELIRTLDAYAPGSVSYTHLTLPTSP